MNKAGTHGRRYVTKHLWVPEKPLARLNLKIADALRKHTPALPLQGDAGGVHTVLFSILDPHSTIPRHRGWATGVRASALPIDRSS